MNQLPRLIRIATAASLAAGVTCQFVQHTDPVFPLAYFTVDSAALAAILASIGIRRRVESDAVAAMRGAATVGVMFSGLVYASVIAPASPTGAWFQPWDDPWVRGATVLMHGVGPVLVTADFLTHPYPDAALRRPWTTAVRWCWWPLLYLGTMVPLEQIGLARIPYAFLQPPQVGVLTVVAGLSVAAGTFIAVGRALLTIHQHTSQ